MFPPCSEPGSCGTSLTRCEQPAAVASSSKAPSPVVGKPENRNNRDESGRIPHARPIVWFSDQDPLSQNSNQIVTAVGQASVARTRVYVARPRAGADSGSAPGAPSGRSRRLGSGGFGRRRGRDDGGVGGVERRTTLPEPARQLLRIDEGARDVLGPRHGQHA